MKRMKLSSQIRKTLPLLVASSVVLTSCSGGQEGDTNGGFAGVGLGSGATTALGVVGGVALVGLLLDDGDDSTAADTAVGGTGDTGTGGTDTGGTGGTDTGGTGGTDTGGTGGTDTGGTGGTDTGGTGGTDTGGTGGTDTGGTGGTDTGGTGGTDTGGTGGTDTGGTGGTDTGGTGGTDTGGTGGTDTGGTGGTDTGGTGGTDTGGTGGTDTGGTGGTDTGGTGGTDTGGTGGTDTGGTGDTDTGGTGGTDTGDTDTGTSLSATGDFAGDIFSDETLPGSNSAEVAVAGLSFGMSNGSFDGTVSGTVTVPAGMDPTFVSLMIGPEGANGFPGVEFEKINATTWAIPATLSAAQIAIIRQNIASGNLYLAVRTAAFPQGELRRQISPSTVYRYVTATPGINGGGTAEGFALVNEATGDYSITWNTSDASLVSAHLNDGIVDDNDETVIASLSQRASNNAQFFAYGNVNDPNDAIPNLEALLSDGQAWLDAHGADGTRRFLGLLSKD